MKKSSTKVIPATEMCDLFPWEPGELNGDFSMDTSPAGLTVNNSPNGRPETPTVPAPPRTPGDQAWVPWQPQELHLLSPHPNPVDPPPDPSDTLIETPAEDPSALDRELAKRILAEAQLKSADMLHIAKEEATAITLRAHLEGQAAAEAEAATLLQSATAIVEEMDEWRESLLTQSEPMVLALVEDIARTLFGRGYSLEPDQLKEVFDRALAEAKSLGDIRIHIHPEDAALLGPHWAEQQTGAHNQNVDLVPDEQIKRGGCLITGAYGSVDARLDHQIETVIETLRQTLTDAEEDSS